MENRGKIVMERYELGRLLGKGAFGKVHYAKNLESNRGVAIKMMDKENVLKVGLSEQIKREITTMRLVAHKNIVQLHEVMATRSKIYFVMEYVKGGELFDKVAKVGKLTEGAAHKFFQQLISAVDHCHSRGVYHRDLKPENLLLDENENLKISDFGLSALSESKRKDGLLHTTCGTPAYVAPEVISKSGYDGATSDIWSCGVILFVLVAGYLPFQGPNLMEMYRKIERGDFRCPSWFSHKLQKLLYKILDPNPSTRISIQKIKESTWFRKGPGAGETLAVKKGTPSENATTKAAPTVNVRRKADRHPLARLPTSLRSPASASVPRSDPNPPNPSPSPWPAPPLEVIEEGELGWVDWGSYKEGRMSRRSVNPSRRVADGGLPSVGGLLHPKSRSPPVLTIALVVLGIIVLIVYFNSGSGVTVTSREAVSRSEGSCTSEVIQALPYLKKAYANEMQKILHVGPDSCTVVSNLLKEGKVEAWGVEPYDLEDVDSSCKSLVRKGFVRMADIKFPLPYRPDSFNLVVVSDALDYLTPRYLNKTLPDLARISTDGLVIFAGNPGQQKAKVSELPKFGRPAKLRSSSWWTRYFIQTGLTENEGPLKKFEQAASKNNYKPDCQIFHLSS